MRLVPETLSPSSLITIMSSGGPRLGAMIPHIISRAIGKTVERPPLQDGSILFGRRQGALLSPPEFLMPTPTYYYIGCGLLLLLALDYYFGCGLLLLLALAVSVARHVGGGYSQYCQAHTFVFGALCVFTGGPSSPLAGAGSAVRKAWAPSGHSVRCCCKSRRVKPQLSPV